MLLGVLIVLALAESAYGMWQFATKAHSVLYLFRPAQYYQRAGGTYICPNHLAGFLEIVLGLLLARMVMHRSSKESVQQTVLQKVFIIYGALMALAGDRKSVV